MRLHLSIGLKYQNGLVITIQDNGAGFAMGEEIAFPEGRPANMSGEEGNPGSSGLADVWARSSDGGSGQGLALHSTMMAVIGGFLSVESVPGQYTRVTLELPEAAWQSWRRT